MSASLHRDECRRVWPCQLVNVVSGNSKIASAVMSIIRKRILKHKIDRIMGNSNNTIGPDWIEFNLEFDCSGEIRGLFLEEVLGDSFSLKYTRHKDDTYFIPVGCDMNATRIRNAGESILAMIVRGRGWDIDCKGRLFEAYGPIKDPHAGLVRKARKHVRYLMNLSRRQQSMHEHYWE